MPVLVMTLASIDDGAGALGIVTTGRDCTPLLKVPIEV